MSSAAAAVDWTVALRALLEASHVDAEPLAVMQRWLPKVQLGPGPDDDSWPSWRGEPCWLWTGARGDRGYGRIQIGQRHFYPHRIGLALAGVILPPPSELEVDHLCRVTSCVRASHLELVTHQENLARHIAASQGGRCRRGHPATDENVYRDAQGRVKYCRPCKREMRAAGLWT